MEVPSHIIDVLRLTLVPGVGPIRFDRLVAHFGDATRVLGASAAALERVPGIGAATARRILEGLREVDAQVDQELSEAQRLGVRLIARGQPDYPSLLATIPSAPPLLYVRGELPLSDPRSYAVAIVGSRRCTAYGIEQAERFAGVLARAGLVIVSGGARGIDTAAHRGAVRSGGRTVVVLGCGLATCYPPENLEFFDQIVEQGRGCLVSELPLRTAPSAENFPARNRIISGLSLGVLVIEAGSQSGARITARLAVEEHGREVMALPGRVDSAASQGANELIKAGEAALVTTPADVLQILETPAGHQFSGTHEARYQGQPAEQDLGVRLRALATGDGDLRHAILRALANPMTLDQLVDVTGAAPARLQAELTLLEIERRVRRDGGVLSLTRAAAPRG